MQIDIAAIRPADARSRGRPDLRRRGQAVSLGQANMFGKGETPRPRNLTYSKFRVHSPGFATVIILAVGPTSTHKQLIRQCIRLCGYMYVQGSTSPYHRSIQLALVAEMAPAPSQQHTNRSGLQHIIYSLPQGCGASDRCQTIRSGARGSTEDIMAIT